MTANRALAKPSTIKSKRPVSEDSGNLLTVLTVAGVIFGGALGFTLRSCTEETWSSREIMYVNFIGELFLRMLKGLTLPLIVSSIVSSIGNLDLNVSGKLAARTIVLFVLTSGCAVAIGVVLAVTISPGNGDEDFDQGIGARVKKRNQTSVDTLLDLARNLFPPNVVQACIRQVNYFGVPALLLPTHF